MYYPASAHQIPAFPASANSPVEPAPRDLLLPNYIDLDDDSPTHVYMDISDHDVRPGEIMDIVSSDESSAEIPVGNLGLSSIDDNPVSGLPMFLNIPDSDSKEPIDLEVEAGSASSRKYTADSFMEFQDDWVD